MRTWHILALGAAIGLLSLLLAPIEQIVPLHAPAIAVRALAIVQPAILTAIAIAVGSNLALKVGLRAPVIDAAISGNPILPILGRQVPASASAGVVVAAVLIAYDIWVAPSMPATSPVAAKLAGFQIPAATRLLYGGIVEEILTRWGLVSLFAWIAWRLAGRPATLQHGYFWIAITPAALLFGLGHLPILFLVFPSAPSWVVLAIIAGNTAPGMIFGWLFWRRGLEAAMIAHALAHAIAAAVG